MLFLYIYHHVFLFFYNRVVELHSKVIIERVTLFLFMLQWFDLGAGAFNRTNINGFITGGFMKYFIAWLLGVPLGLLIIIYLVSHIF